MAQLGGGDSESEGTRTEQSGERKMKKGKSMVSQNVKKKNKREVNEWLGSLVSLRLVRSQTTVFGMKTGRAVCTSQAWNFILLNKLLFF